MLILFTAFSFISTMLGGLFALKYKDKLHLIMGFSSGVIMGVVLFELLPEIVNLSLELNSSFENAMLFTAVGFLVYHLAEKIIVIHASEEDDTGEKGSGQVGILGASGFTLHSFIDGIAIGLSFAASEKMGMVVAFAIVAHKFADGLNTTTVMIRNKNSRGLTMTFLLLNSTAPLLGVFFSSLFHFPQGSLILILSLFCGFFMYIGAADLLPEAHHKHSSFFTMILTVLGFIFVFLVSRMVG